MAKYCQRNTEVLQHKEAQFTKCLSYDNEQKIH